MVLSPNRPGGDANGARCFNLGGRGEQYQRHGAVSPMRPNAAKTGYCLRRRGRPWHRATMANDEANERTPWTIKGMDVETRKLVVNCATQRGQSVATWLETAVRNQANLEAGDRVIMPGQPGQTAASGGQTGFALDELEQFARVCSLLAESAGKPVPRTVTRLMWARVRERLGDGALGMGARTRSPVKIAMPYPPDGDQADQQDG